MRLLLLPASFCALVALGTPASAWSTAPWDSTPFDSAVGLPASTLAKIAAAEALTTAMSSKRVTTSGNITNSGTCGVSLGDVVLQKQGQAQNAVSNVVVNGNVINVCH